MNFSMHVQTLRCSGTQWRLMTPYTPEQNVIVVRNTWTLVVLACCLLLNSDSLPLFGLMLLTLLQILSETNALSTCLVERSPLKNTLIDFQIYLKQLENKNLIQGHRRKIHRIFGNVESFQYVTPNEEKICIPRWAWFCKQILTMKIPLMEGTQISK